MDDKPRIEPDETLDQLLDRVERGEQVTISRDGQVVAKLVAGEPERDVAAAMRAMKSMLELSKDVHLGDGLTFKDLVDEGRKY